MRLLACLVCAIAVLHLDAQEKRPNVIAIVTDDQGRWAMGTYDNPEIHTPNMDRIGKEGAVFLNAFVATPVCSPSRATYLTGRYPTELGITDWIAPIESDNGLGLTAVTWPKILQQNGYKTGLVGKWHLGTQPQFHPTKLGFDHFMGFLEGGTRPMDAPLEVDGKVVKTEGPLPDVLVDDAIRFVDANKDRPFALCLHFRAPHLPYGPVPESDTAHYTDLDPTIPEAPGLAAKKVKESTRAYYASISSVDRNIGRLLGHLNKLGLEENTLVLFTSDHGYNEGRHSIDTKGNGQWIAGGLRGPKRPNMWDTSIRVPLVARWPAVIKPGTKVQDTVCQIDMFRTILGSLQIEVPQDLVVRGRDFSPTFRGESLPPLPAIFGQYDLHNGGLAYMRMVRTDRYKYVRHFKANFMDELYDLKTDPDEQRNLIRRDDAPKVLEELDRLLTQWQKSINDPILQSSY